MGESSGVPRLDLKAVENMTLGNEKINSSRRLQQRRPGSDSPRPTPELVAAMVREYLQQVDETKPRHSMEAKPVTFDAIEPHQNTSVDLRQLAAADVGLELVWDPRIERFGTSIAASVRTTYRAHSQCRRFVA